ncbi:lytic transglycosylase domain-containing protein [Cohnella thailandensis]|uniref:Lytic transglycosylase domain-containing protein n=2 Tax=Cohnella thailandensis TaxID=557557 RepID=A0A841SVC0_9BACL|nr:lytic transglycosylase domain-containing protein [Cohnella thailandensis]
MKELLLSQFLSGVNPFDTQTSYVSSTDGGDDLFSQLLEQMLSADSDSYGDALANADFSSLSGSYGLGLSGLSGLGGLVGYGAGLDSSSTLSGLSGYGGLGLGYSSGSAVTSLLGGIAGGGLTNDTGFTSAYDSLILQAANRYGVDPALIKGVIQSESSFRENAVSSAGAKGLMQLMDATAQGLGVTDSFDPMQNIDAGTRYLSYLLRKYNGNEATALAAYNAGPGRVDRLGITTNEELAARLTELPEETQAYIQKVLSNRNIWSSAL